MTHCWSTTVSKVPSLLQVRWKQNGKSRWSPTTEPPCFGNQSANRSAQRSVTGSCNLQHSSSVYDFAHHKVCGEQRSRSWSRAKRVLNLRVCVSSDACPSVLCCDTTTTSVLAFCSYIHTDHVAIQRQQRSSYRSPTFCCQLFARCCLFHNRRCPSRHTHL